MHEALGWVSRTAWTWCGGHTCEIRSSRLSSATYRVWDQIGMYETQFSKKKRKYLCTNIKYKCYENKSQGDIRRYLCLKESPPCRSSAFSRLSMAILQVRLAFRHEVWLLEEEGSHMRSWWLHQADQPKQCDSEFNLTSLHFLFLVALVATLA